MKKEVMYVLLFFFVVLTGFIIITATSDLDTSSWSFLGSDMAKLLVPYIGHIYILIASGILVLHGWTGD